MWYKTGKAEIYWLVGYDQPAHMPDMDQPIKATGLLVRAIKNTDKLWDEIIYNPPGTEFKFKYKIFVEGEESLAPPKVDLKDYPKHPNYVNLKEFVRKYTRDGSWNLRLEDYSLTVNNDSVSLSWGGGTVLRWVTDGTTGFHIVDATIAPYKTYGDVDFEYRSRDGYWQVRSPKSDWLPIFHGLTFTPDLTPTNEAQALIHLTSYQRGIKVIDNYIANISTETIAKVVGDAPPKSVIASRCDGCHANNRNHYKIHMQRNELPFYLIFWVIADSQKEVPLVAVWNLIGACRNNDSRLLKGFKEELKTFLVNSTIYTELLLDSPYQPGPHGMTPQKSPKFWKNPKKLTFNPTDDFAGNTPNDHFVGGIPQAHPFPPMETYDDAVAPVLSTAKVQWGNVSFQPTMTVTADDDQEHEDE